jgi:hypothetical protein
VVERGSAIETVVPVAGATLRRLADAAGADLGAGFSVGHDTPALGDVDGILVADHGAALALGAWYELGAKVLDETLANVVGASRPQLWPEHFDLGCDVPVGPAGGPRCNLGASPGDGFDAGPYLYVGPWEPERPGGAGYWNVPFGAVLRRADIAGAEDPVAVGTAFMAEGLSRLHRC